MGPGPTLEHIDAVDAFANTLYVRLKASSGSPFAEVATTVRRLQHALRHLRVEAADPDSLLQNVDNPIYERQLRPLVQDCEYALRQLEAALERWKAGAAGVGTREAEALADRVAAVRARLVREKTSVDMFLDTVQLHNPANNAPEVHAETTSDTSLERIKDKVDRIAEALFPQRHTSSSEGTSADEDQMWQEFQSRLEKAGFSSHVLHRHKDVLRAYIRELQSMSPADGGAPPTVRQLLEHEARTKQTSPPVPPKEPLSPVHSKSPKQLSCPGADDITYRPSLNRDHRMSEHGSPLTSPHRRAGSSSFSSEQDGEQRDRESNGSLALISTKDLVALDGIESLMANTHLNSAASHPPIARHIRSSSSSFPSLMAGSRSPPPYPAPSSQRSTHSPRRSSLTGRQPSSYAPASSSSPRTTARLAPDRYGKDIPMDAPWTKVNRSLVSPEVLERAGVRYEARPEYVAILGRLSREQLAEYARQSAHCRAARSSYPGHAPPRRANLRDDAARHPADSKNNRQDNSDESSWNESDTSDYDDDENPPERAREPKRHSYIVSPPNERKSSTSATEKPKPILKNKNENHVRFDPEPHELKKISTSPRSYDDDHRNGHDARRQETGSRRHRDSRDRDTRHHRPARRSSSDRGDRERRRDRRDRRDERHGRRKAWGETIGAVGIGGAAASLLGVLTEAAVGM
ncbi:uncharacterized protein CPUR_00977 [Claviceps purpurea 20.1]|uniref:DUF8035 domain-containing protein n=1 Tax=Claviceps purpurea (strain 20.1) TaxID=1111077 RepID=M1W5X6_CLAP2|nr:uncharacterized protein CPUR_00977 [Claviceps purpurea 20.1]